jgi:hypothetical protein
VQFKAVPQQPEQPLALHCTPAALHRKLPLQLLRALVPSPLQTLPFPQSRGSELDAEPWKEFVT